HGVLGRHAGRCEAVLRRERIVAFELRVDRVLEVRLDPRREDTDRADEREADHQRRGGRRRARRVPHCVLTREAAGNTAAAGAEPGRSKAASKGRPWGAATAMPMKLEITPTAIASSR